MTFGEFVNSFYLQVLDSSVSHTTVIEYKRKLNNYILPFFEKRNKDIKDIKVFDIQLFIAYLQECEISSNSIRNIYAIIHSIFNYAVSYEIIESSPCKPLSVRLPRAEQKEIDIFNTSECLRFIEALYCEPYVWQLYFLTLLATAARRAEVCSLQWKDLDLENSSLKISKSCYKETGKPWTVKVTKGSKERVVFVPDSLLQALLIFKDLQETEQEDDYFIFSCSKEVFNPNTATTHFRKFLKDNNFKYHKLHSLRHTAATLLLSNNIDIYTVKSLLGHSTISTTEKYLHLVADNEIKAVNVMNDILFKSDFEQNKKEAHL